MEKRPPDSAGFTLMELAIAVAVVLIGILALFALISSGLDSSARSVVDTQSSVFADSVFNGIGAVTQVEAEKGKVGNIVQWRKFWMDFAAGTTNILVPSTNVWHWAPHGSFRRPFAVYGDGATYGVRTNKYEAVSQHPLSTVGKVMHGALRYKLTIEPPITAAQLPLLSNTVQRVTLQVWGGEFGSIGDDEALIFYSEFDNPGDL